MPADGEFELAGGRVELRGGALVAASGIGVVVVLWLVAYLSGLAPWLGFMDKSYRNISAGAVTIAGQTSSGSAFGPTSFAFLAGQEVYVDYDITLRRGAVLINVLEYAGMEHTLWHTVTRSGSGTASVRIPRTGLYHITVEPTVVGGVGQGYDLDISASWGARWP